MPDERDVISKTPPHDLEAERSVLGGILLDNRAIYKIIEILDEEDFYRGANRKIYAAMKALFQKDEPFDTITLADILKEQNRLDDVGGVTYISSLMETVGSSANIEHHARIIRDKSLKRRLIEAATRITADGYEDSKEAGEFLDQAEYAIFEISERRIRRPYYALGDIVKTSFKVIEDLSAKKKVVTGVPTGFKDFDKLTAGLQRSDLIIIAGRPGMGKTAIALNIAQNAAMHNSVEDRIAVAFFSLEMSKEQLVIRMLCSEARVDGNKVKTGFMSKSDWSDLTLAAGRMSKAPIFIDDSAALSVLELRAKARRLKSEHNVGLIIVDYLQLMRASSSVERREQEISEISRSLKALAKEIDVPVIALSQLNRLVETRPDKRPRLADLRESGAIEQDADLIAFVYRDEFYHPEKEDNKGLAELILGKQRNGPTGSVPLQFLSTITTFKDSTRREYDGADSGAESFPGSFGQAGSSFGDT